MSSTPPPQASPSPTPPAEAASPAPKPSPTSNKSRTDKTAPAVKTEPAPKAEPKAKPAPKASTKSADVVALSPRNALNLQSAAAPGLANRPIDPSPIQVSRSVSLAGVRPIGVSVNPQPIILQPTSMVLNRPIANNSTDDDDTLMGYLD